MTKTKRQERAEAVERLKRMDGWCDESKAAADFMKALLWDLRIIDGEHVRDALIDLLTDDEPPEGDAVAIMRRVAGNQSSPPACALIWYVGISDGPSASISETQQAFNMLADMVERDYVQREAYDALLEECEEFEHIVDERIDELQAQVDQLRGDLEGARKSRDHWRRVASKHGAEIRKIKAQLADAREYGAIWPRFEDGALVKPFDKVYGFDSGGVQEFIYTTSANGSWQLQDAGGNVLNVFPMADGLNRVKRSPLMSADGQPIEVGQVLYGEDGKAWEVECFDRKRKWSVWAHDASDPGRHKCLKPEWLVHETPDSPEDMASTVRTWLDVDPDARSVTVMRYALENLVERIETLGGGR